MKTRAQRPSQPEPLVLLAEDDAGLGALYLTWLTADGCRVEFAQDGAAALELVGAAGLPDAAILDVNMPRVDGLAVCRRLRALSGDLPIVIVSGSDDAEALGLSAGANTVLAKPAEQGQLCTTLRSLLAVAATRAGRSAYSHRT
jgi:two-component system response regulator MprA